MKVTWPAKRTYAPGEPLTVKVASKRPVRVAFVRESARGRIMRTVARKTLRHGTFSAAAPSAGRYSLRVGRRHRTVTVVAPTPVPPPMPVAAPTDPCAGPTGPPAAELRLGASTVAPGGSLPYDVVNTGGTCLSEGAPYALEHQLGDGSWASVPLPWYFPLFLVVVPPGGSYAKSAKVPADAVPGAYRLLDTPAHLSAQFTVTG